LPSPGGNTTGVTLLASELDCKRQEILIEAVPGVRRIAALVDTLTTTPLRLTELEDAARARGIALSGRVDALNISWNNTVGAPTGSEIKQR
jgi:hypothetical protein